MSNEVKLKARIQNKYDTLENWNKLIKGDFIPLKGEVCYAIDNNKLYQKVGDGKTDFLDLSWLLNQGDWNEENEFSPEYIKNKPMKIITEPTHIADLDVGTYIIKSNLSDLSEGDELIGVTLANINEEEQLEDDFWEIYSGTLTISHKYEEETDEYIRVATSFVANGNMNTPDWTTLSEMQDDEGNIYMESEICSIKNASNVEMFMLISTKFKEDQGNGIEAGKWYSSLDHYWGHPSSDIPASALVETIDENSTRFKVPTAKAVYEFGQALQADNDSSAIKTITTPCHIADLDVGTYLVNGNILDVDNELGQVIIQNVTPDGKINDRYFILFNGIISITQKYIINEDDTEERIAISFTASGNMSTPDGINIAETTGEDGSIVMVETIATTAFSSSVSYIIAEYVKPKVDNPDKGYVAGQWYNEDLFSSIGDVSCEALTEEITSESTRFKVPTAKAVYEFGQTLQAGGGSSVQPDYLQNDSSAKDYIKNRPFYTETVTEINRDIIPLQKVEFIKDTDMFQPDCVYQTFKTQSLICHNGTYNLSIDGVDTPITVTVPNGFSMEDGVLEAGNRSFLLEDDGGGLSNTGESYYCRFVMTEDEDEESLYWTLYLALKSTETAHTIGLSYIGDTMPILGEGKYAFEQRDSKESSGSRPYREFYFGTICKKDTFNLNDIYNITFNGTTYKNISLSVYPDGMGFGDVNIPYEKEPLEKDFFIMFYWEDEFIEGEIYTSLPQGEYTVSFEKVLTPIEKEVVKKLDSKFTELPCYTETETLSREIAQLQNCYFMEKKEEDDEGNEIVYIFGAPMLSPSSYPIIAGNEYCVVLDDTETQLIAKEQDEDIYLGNLALLPWANELENIEDSGETFLLISDSGFFIDPSKFSAGVHKFGVSYIDESERVVLLSNKEFSKEDLLRGIDIDWMGGLQTTPGDRFKLTVNDEVYELTLEGDYQLYAGNKYLYDSYYPDTGENYCLHAYEGECDIDLYYRTEEELCNVSLEFLPREIVHKIDSKYIDLSEVEEKVNDLRTDVTSINKELANQTVQLVEGIVGDSKTRGLSANRNTIPTAEGAWIEGGARRVKVLQYNPTVLIQGQTITLTFPYTNDIYEYVEYGDCLAIIFNSEPDKTYYFEVTGNKNENFSKVVLTANLIINTDTFPADTSKILSMKLYDQIGKYSHTEGRSKSASGESSHAEGVDTRADGKGSHAEGYSTYTSGDYSHAEGSDTTAYGNDSHAEGCETHASGNASHAEGVRTTASLYASHAEGYETSASDSYSHAEGWCTTASNTGSHAEGRDTKAYGSFSHVEGWRTTASNEASHAEGYGTTASGMHSHAEGNQTTASGDDSHAEGCATTASNDYAHAEGHHTTASGYNSHAEGCGTTSSGKYSHAEGNQTTASGEYQHVQGRYNIEDTENKYAHIVGNGTNDDNRSNAYTLDWEGNAEFTGIVKSKGKELVTKEEMKNISTNYVILTDIENGFKYALQMKGGGLVTKSLPIKIEITTSPNKMTYYRGDYFDPTGMIVTGILPDGSTEIIEDYTSPNIEIPFDSIGGEEVVIQIETLDLSVGFIVNVVEFEPDEVLVDFIYTTNEDGTYTLTGWNQTLNGEPSTELIIPNNLLVKL